MSVYNQFLDSWNSVIGFTAPEHHYRMTEFLGDIVNGDFDILVNQR